MTHRRVKYVSYDDDEFNDYDGDDGYDEHAEGFTPEDEAEMRAGSVAVRAELGEASEAIDEKEIRDALWYYYFDVGKSVDYLRRQHAPKETPKKEKQKQPSRFDQAAAAAKSKAGAGVPRCRPILPPPSWNKQCSNHTSSSTLFADTPFLAVPPERLGALVPVIKRPCLREGLLGGSSSGGSKPSKLAALAASRKKAAEEKKKAIHGSKSSATAPPEGETKAAEPIGSVALLDKLDRDKLQKPAEEKSTSKQPKPNKRSYPTREKAYEEPAPAEVDTIMEDMPSVEATVPEETADDLIATPSMFAQSLFATQTSDGANNYKSRAKDEHSNRSSKLFTLPYPVASEPQKKNGSKAKGANSNPFSGPSPDDIVTQAQSKGTKTSNKNSTKPNSAPQNDGKTASSTAADGVAALKLDDSTPASSRVKSKNLNVLSEYEKSNIKNAANFVVIGHVDHGKSTLMGRLLHDLSLIPTRSFQKLQASSQQAGKSSFSFAWLLDTTESERSRGITVDVASTTFSTPKTNFTILDAPGHKDFVPNMIAGTSQADFAVLVVDSSTDAFEKGMEGGGQTKEHALLARALGINRVIVVVNKMDSATPPWSQARFDTVSQQMSSFLSTAGFASKNVAFVPCSGLTGQNVVEALPSKTKEGEPAPWSWYTGPTFLSQLDTTGQDTTTTSKQHIAAPLRLAISDIFRASVTSPLAISARIDAGSLQVGDVVLAMPAGETATIKGIEVDASNASESNDDDDDPMNRGWAVAGQIVTAHLTDIDPVHLRLGDVLCSTQHPVHNVREFAAKILAFDFVVPSAVDCHHGRMHAEAKISSLLEVMDKGGGADGAAKSKKKPRVVKPGAIARVRVELVRHLPLEAGARIVLRSEGVTVAAGLVEDVEVTS